MLTAAVTMAKDVVPSSGDRVLWWIVAVVTGWMAAVYTLASAFFALSFLMMRGWLPPIAIPLVALFLWSLHTIRGSVRILAATSPTRERTG